MIRYICHNRLAKASHPFGFIPNQTKIMLCYFVLNCDHCYIVPLIRSKAGFPLTRFWAARPG